MDLKLAVKILTQFAEILALFLVQPQLITLIFGKDRIETFAGFIRNLTVAITNISARSVWRFSGQNLSPTITIEGVPQTDEDKLLERRLFIRHTRQAWEFFYRLDNLSERYTNQGNIDKEKAKRDIRRIAPPLISPSEELQEVIARLLTEEEPSTTKILGDVLREKGTTAQYLKSVKSALRAAFDYSALFSMSLYIAWTGWSLISLYTLVAFQIASLFFLVNITLLVSGVLRLMEPLKEKTKSVIDSCISALPQHTKKRATSRLLVIGSNVLFGLIHRNLLVRRRIQKNLVPIVITICFIASLFNAHLPPIGQVALFIIGAIGTIRTIAPAFVSLFTALVTPLGLLAHITLSLIARRADLPRKLAFIGITMFIAARVLTVFS